MLALLLLNFSFLSSLLESGDWWRAGHCYILIEQEWWADLPLCSRGYPCAIKEGGFALSASSPRSWLSWVGTSQSSFSLLGEQLQVPKRWAADRHVTVSIRKTFVPCLLHKQIKT